MRLDNVTPLPEEHLIGYVPEREAEVQLQLRGCTPCWFLKYLYLCAGEVFFELEYSAFK